MLKKAKPLKTRLATKGQVILPRGLREKHGWKPGKEFIVEERPDGVFLKDQSAEQHTKIQDAFGCLGPAQRIVSVEEMQEAITDEARRRWGREYDDRN